MLAQLRKASLMEWVLLFVMLWLSVRYFWLLDDAFIYFRYVDNLVFLGRGLVYNTGEFVEGYTSPLWVLLLAALRTLGVDYWHLVLALAMASVLTSWLMLVELDRRLTDGNSLRLPMVLCATHYGILSYFSSGLEAALITPVSLGYALVLTKPTSRSAWLLGLAPLVRPEFALLWAGAVVGLALWQRAAALRVFLGGVLCSGLWLFFRIGYYADLLPNTFYLKAHSDWSQGLAYLENSGHGLGVPALLLLGLLFAPPLLRRLGGDGAPVEPLSHPKARLTLLACALSLLLFVVQSGGDMLYFRFLLCPVVLIATASQGVVERAASSLARLSWGSDADPHPAGSESPRGPSPASASRSAGGPLPNGSLPRTLKRSPSVLTKRAVAWMSTLLLAAYFAAVYPAQLSKHPLSIEEHETDTIVKRAGISEASWHRQHPELRWTEDRAAEDRALRELYRNATEDERRQERLITEGWCATAWRRFDRYVVHGWGLTEPILARSEVPLERPGHKYGLLRLAEDIAQLKRQTRFPPRLSSKTEHDLPFRGQGLLGRAAQERPIPDWITRNLASITLIEQKSYNTHGFLQNLALSLTPVPRLEISSDDLR